MGRSAKVHKRPQKKTSSTAASAPVARPAAKAPAAAPTPKEQKRHAGLKAKVAKHRKEGEGPVLGGADYVELMLGGRRKAMQEAAKLPKDADE